MIIVDDDRLPNPNLAGVHEDNNGQPFALVRAAGKKGKIDDWSVAASHEVLEMLVDPYGNRLVAGDVPQQAVDTGKVGKGRVLFLLEICDPSEATDFGYSSNGVLVSDFYTPSFFDTFRADGVRYSFTGQIKTPRQVLRGGYLSWKDPSVGEWRQLFWEEGRGKKADVRPLVSIEAKPNGNLRSAVDRELMVKLTQKATARGRGFSTRAGRAGNNEDVNSGASRTIAEALKAIVVGGGHGGGRPLPHPITVGDVVGGGHGGGPPLPHPTQQ